MNDLIDFKKFNCIEIEEIKDNEDNCFIKLFKHEKTFNDNETGGIENWLVID